MNGLQIIMLLFSLIAVGVDVYAIVAIVRSPALKYKPLWIIGSLFGFLGLGINWTNPNDIVFEFGIQIPVFQVMFFMQTRELAVKTMFPIIALVALARSSAATEQPQTGESAPDGAD